MSEDSGTAPLLGTAGSRHPTSTTTSTTGPESTLTVDETTTTTTSPSNGGFKAVPLYSARSPASSPGLNPAESLDPELFYSPARSPEAQPRPLPPPRPKSTLRDFWERNRGPILVAVSQLFGALMNLSARLLEFEGEGMHPVQVLFLRQSTTSLLCTLYMWWTGMADALIGPREIRGLLFVRGFSGFFGIYGMWYSMMYLPLADATVITFLAPGVAGVLCYFFLRQPFTRPEQLATVVALLGVVLIAQPASLFSGSSSSDEDPTPNPDDESDLAPGLGHEPTPEERLTAVGMALLGVCGAAGAFTTLRIIGKRAHPLVSVNYFGLTCTVICLVVLGLAPLLDIGQPSLHWKWPASARGWLLLALLGFMGFAMQYLLTAGLQSDKSNRANSMVYTHMLFAVSFDRWVFHHEMNLMSFGGCVLILGSALSVVFLKRPAAPKADDVEGQRPSAREGEQSPMLVSVGGDNTDDVSLSRM